jgi:thiamine-phosphate pyrophosphorylase
MWCSIPRFVAPSVGSVCWTYCWLSASLALVLVPQVSLPNSSAPDSKGPPDRKPILCYVTDRRSLQAASQVDLIEPLLEKIELAAAAGVDWIQLREKGLPGKRSALLAHEALSRVSKQPSQPQAATSKLARIIVNDRLDVALAAQADGLHLGENSLPVEEAKRLLLSAPAAQTRARDFILGVSCHSLDAALSAASSGADYIFFGPVFATPSKAAYGSPQGLDRLATVCSSVNIPVLAIGGITLANVSSCLSAGASGIAAIRLFQDSADPTSVVRAIREQNS